MATEPLTGHLPAHMIVQVRCKEGHSLRGLFVLMKAAPLGGNDHKNLRLLEKLNAIVTSGDSGGQGPLAPTDNDDDDRDDPSVGYVLGVVDGDGFLQPVDDVRNPWCDVLAEGVSRNPHAYKLTADTPYVGYLLRHPSPDLARLFLAYLNGERGAERERFRAWGSPRALPLRLDRHDGCDQMLLAVDESADAFVPRGHDLYEGWALYRNMPGEACACVRKQVERLQYHLAAMRYPVGDGNKPYLVERGAVYDDELKKVVTVAAASPNLASFDERTQACVHQFQRHAAAGTAFLVADKTRVHGTIVKLDDAAHFGPQPPTQLLPPASNRRGHKPGWAALIGAERNDAPRLSVDAFGAGVVDHSTSEAVRAWIDGGFRKPGPVLVEVGARQEEQTIHGRPVGQWATWLRQEAAIAVEAWRELIRCFGVPYGLAINHTYRDLMADFEHHGVGVLKASIHKTGLAIDLGMVGSASKSLEDYALPVPEWPIRYEAHWIPVTTSRPQQALASARARTKAAEKAASDAHDALDKAEGAHAIASATRGAERADAALEKAQAKEQEAQRAADAERASALPTKALYRINWRLYGHSSLDVFGAGARDAIATLRTNLSGFADALRVLLRDFLGPAADLEGAQEWVDTQVTAVSARAVALGNSLDADDGARSVIEQYFRDAIRPWIYNLYEADGGTSGPPVRAGTESASSTEDYLNTADSRGRATLGAVDGGAAVNARSFVNLSALAYLVDVHRIGASSGWKDATADKGAKKAGTRTFAMADLGSIVGLVDRMWRPESAHFDDPVIVARGGKRDGVTLQRERGSLDLDFMRAWARTLGTLTPTEQKHATTFNVVKGAQVSVTLGASGRGKDGAELVISALQNDFADKPFVLLVAGPKTTLDADVDARHTGSEWATRVRSALDAISRDATVNVVKDSEKKSAKGRTESKRKDAADWTLVLQPVFERTPAEPVDGATRASVTAFLADDRVTLPTPGIGRALEWWHFQSGLAVGARWGDLLDDLGYSRDALGAANPPEPSRSTVVAQAGVGYTEDELDSTRAGGNRDPIENRNPYDLTGELAGG